MFIGKIMKYEGGVVSKIFINIGEDEVIAEYKLIYINYNNQEVKLCQNLRS